MPACPSSLDRCHGWNDGDAARDRSVDHGQRSTKPRQRLLPRKNRQRLPALAFRLRSPLGQHAPPGLPAARSPKQTIERTPLATGGCVAWWVADHRKSALSPQCARATRPGQERPISHHPCLTWLLFGEVGFHGRIFPPRSNGNRVPAHTTHHNSQLTRMSGLCPQARESRSPRPAQCAGRVVSRRRTTS